MAALVEGPQTATAEELTLVSDGAPLRAVHACPQGDPLGALVLVPDVAGLRPLFTDLCRRLATHGLAVCAVEPFSRLETAAGRFLDTEERKARAGEVHDETVMADLAVAADHLGAADHIGGTAVVGFCLGGAFALKAAATGRFERAVAFYPVLRTPPAWAAGQKDALASAGAVGAEILVIAGGLDPFTPPDDLDLLRKAWEGRSGHKVVVYPQAEHAFVHVPDRDVHRPDDAADAWHRALTFLLA